MLNGQAWIWAYNLAMPSPPGFLKPDRMELTERSFRPYPPDRKGEILAWVITLGAVLIGVLMRSRTGEWPAVTIGLALFTGLAAASITFGNWVDRATRIWVTQEEVQYRNGLRTLTIRWEDVRGLSAYPLARGWRIEVENPAGRLSFRTPAELKFASLEGMWIGIQDGHELVRVLIAGARLGAIERQGEGWRLSREASDGPDR